MRYPGFLGSSDASQSVVANGERTINWRIELLPRHSKNQIALFPTEGQTRYVSVSDVGTRALFTMNDRTLGVIGSGVWGIDATKTTTKYGSVVQDGHLAQITMNGKSGNQAFIGSGTNGYNFDLSTNTLTLELTGSAVQVAMLDGYFIAFDKANSRIYLSDPNDGTVWDPTQFSGRSAAPDNWQAMAVNPPDIWLIGSQSGDVWFDSGDFPFPFAPRPGATFKYGTPATYSVAVGQDSVLWLSQNAEGAGVVVQARGYTPQIVSTPSVEARIAGYQRDAIITDAEGWIYQKTGHTFYVLRFPTAHACEVYDLSIGQWHERGTWIPSLNRYDCWHPRCHTYAFGLHLVGEDSTGQLSILDEQYGTEADGSAIRRVRVTPGLFVEDRRIPIRQIEIYVERGVSTSTGQGSDAMLMLQMSRDGGKTWGRERQASIGKIGEYTKRMAFTRFGSPRDPVFKISASDPVPFRIIDAYVNNDDRSVTT